MRESNSLSATLGKSPILWGGLACAGFYGLVSSGTIDGQFVRNYFAGHPVEYAATAMFFVGLAALTMKLFGTNAQLRLLSQPLLEPIVDGGQPVSDCSRIAEQLDRLPSAKKSDYLVVRLREVVEHVRRSGTADGIEDELRYLADIDAARVHAGYGLVRVIIWAIPVLGFLGTVIGITMAIGKLSPEALETSLPEVMGSLSVAFYTTTQALGLSIVLMFAQFIVDRKENRLLDRVDQRVEAEMVGRFERSGAKTGNELAVVERMAEAVIASTEKLVARQAELWASTIKVAEQRWATTTDASARQLQDALTGALDESLGRHADKLLDGEFVLTEKNRQNWERLQDGLLANTSSVGALQKAVLEKAELIANAVDATEQVAALEGTLNSNLRALAGSNNFEQTVMSLAAAIHLLNSRLGQFPDGAPVVHLEPERKTGQAA